MSFDERRRKITTYTTTTTRSGFGSQSNRSAFGYWIPLALTVTAATVGLVAWIWSERSDDDEYEYSSSDEREQREHYYGSTGPVPGSGPSGGGEFAAGAAMAGGAAAGYAMSGGLPPGPGPAGFQGGPPPGPGMGQPPTAGGFQGGPPPGPTGFQDNRAMSTGIEERSNINVNVQENNSFYSRMTSALGFGYNNPATATAQDFPPPPMQEQQQQTWIGKGMATAAAGAAAAGAVVGSAVKSLREAGDENFSDQEHWSEEADKPERSSPKKGIRRTGTAEEFYSGAVEVPRRSSVGATLGKRKTVAIVVSSIPTGGSDSADVGIHASILAHLPEHVNPDRTRIFVLIYAPDLSVHPLSAAAATNQAVQGSTLSRVQQPEKRSSSRHSEAGQSTTSSYANIMTPGPDGQTPAHTPGDFPVDPSNTDPGILTSVSPRPLDSSSALPTRAVDNDTSALYKTLHNQALALVDRDTMIIPFTTSNGHKHILRSIAPEVVYIQESLCGRDGDLVADLQGWVRQVVVVIGDEGGLGGLVDTDTENEDDKGRGRTGRTGTQWWAREEVTGLGRGVGVVEALRVGEDWRRRVGEED